MTIKYTREQKLNNKEKSPIPIECRPGGSEHPDTIKPEPTPAPPETPRGYEEKKQPQVYENIKPTRKKVAPPATKPKDRDAPLSVRMERAGLSTDNPPEPYVHVPAVAKKNTVCQEQPCPHTRQSEPTTPSIIKRETVSHDYSPPAKIEMPEPTPYVRGHEEKKQPQPIEKYVRRKKKIKPQPTSIKKEGLPIEVRMENAQLPPPPPPEPYVLTHDEGTRRAAMRQQKDISQPPPHLRQPSEPVMPTIKKLDAPGREYLPPPPPPPPPPPALPRGYEAKPKPPPQPEQPMTFQQWIKQKAPAIAVLCDLENHLRNVRGFRPTHNTLVWLLTPDALCGTLVKYDGQQYSLPAELVARINTLPKGEYLCSGPWGNLKNYHAWLRNEKDVLYPNYREQFALEHP